MLDCDIDTVRQLFSTYVEDIGDEINESFSEGYVVSEIRDKEIDWEGMKCGHGGHSYLILLHPDVRYGRIDYFYSLPQSLSNQLPEVIVDEWAEDNTENSPLSAARGILQTRLEEEWRMFADQIYLVSGGGSLGVEISHGDHGILESVHVSNKFFPYEEKMKISEFEEEVQSTISTGARAQTYIRTGLRFQLDVDNPSEAEVTITK